MKNLKTTFAILLFAMLTFTVTSCKNEKKQETKEMEMDMHDEGMEESDDHDEGEEQTHDAGDHMGHMNDVKAWLQKELGDSYDDKVSTATKEQLVTGKKIFDTTCALCHGATGKGDGAAAAGFETKPADFTDSEHSAYYSDQGRIHIIKNGVEGTPMVGWSASYSQEEIISVYGYVRSLRVVSSNQDLGEGMYTCSMHPEVSGNKGGKCPKCGMTLVPKENKKADDGHDHVH
jgi:mono/diheme cytochrome c family protein